jgi:PAS domain S-box-containing protein
MKKHNLFTTTLPLTFLFILIGMSVFEMLKQFLHPNITIWESHVITIFFSSVLGTVVTYFAARSRIDLLTKLYKEINDREATEVALQKSNDDLERLVNDRTNELSGANRELQGKIIERKRAEEELESLNQRLQLATSSAHLGVWDWNVRDNAMDWDDRMFELYGISRESFPNSIDAWQNGLHPEDKETAIAACQAALNGEQEFNTEFRILLPDGTERYIKATGLVIKGTDGTAERMIGINSDISKRKLAEIANTRFLLRQRAILDNLPMMAWLKDTESRLEMVNQLYAESCGRTIEECLGKTDSDLFPQEFAAIHIADDREVCKSGQRKQVEEQIGTPDGVRWAFTCKTPIADEQGNVVGTAGIALDITERKQSEEALRDREQRLNLAVKTLNLGIWEWNVSDDSTIWNDEMFNIYGITTEQFTGKGTDYINFTRHDYRDIQAENLRRAFEAGVTDAELSAGTIPASSPKELCIVRPDGSECFTLGDAVAIVNNDRKPLRMIGVTLDITERKQAELEKIRLEAQLHQAQKMESVGRLAGGVAHDFNNLLTVILGGAHLALTELEPDQPLHEYVTQIKKAGEKSADLTQQLLAFARKQTIEPKVLDLNDTVSGMLRMLQRLIGENTQLAWLPSNNLWAVKADPSQIDQILANLCVNARDSITDVGTITIRTGNSVVDDGYRADHIDVVPGEYVHISVSDTGCGMDKETLAHIFEPFFTTKGPGEGTGLGLATVYGAAKQNNGFVNVYSEPGIGTTFTIYLPKCIGSA